MSLSLRLAKWKLDAVQVNDLVCESIWKVFLHCFPGIMRRDFSFVRPIIPISLIRCYWTPHLLCAPHCCRCRGCSNYHKNQGFCLPAGQRIGSGGDYIIKVDQGRPFLITEAKIWEKGGWERVNGKKSCKPYWKGSLMWVTFQPPLGHIRMSLGPGTLPYQGVLTACAGLTTLCVNIFLCFTLNLYAFA